MIRPLKQKQTIALLGLVVLLGALLRFYRLGEESYWYDEVIMAHLVQLDLSSIYQEALGGRPPLYVLLGHYWVQWFGTGESTARALSALAGTASIVVIYAVGRELFGRRVGLLSALLMAISEFQIWYSQEFRYYSVVVLTTLLSVLFLLRALKSGQQRYWLAHTVATALLFYTHTTGVFLIMAQNIYVLLRYRSLGNFRRSWIVGQALLLLLISPYFIQFMQAFTPERSTVIKPALDPPLWMPLKTAVKFQLPGHYDLGPAALVLVAAAGIMFGLAGTGIYAWWKGRACWFQSLQRWATHIPRRLQIAAPRLLALVCWLVVPLLLLFLLSKFYGPVYRSKYVACASPAVHLLLAWGIVSIRRIVPEFVVAGTLILWIVPGLTQYYRTDVKEQWRQAAAYMEKRAGQADLVVFPHFQHHPYKHHCLKWYFDGDLLIRDVDLHDVRSTDAAVGRLSACADGHAAFWFVSWEFDDGYYKRLGQLDFLHHTGRTVSLVSQRDFKGVSVYLFRFTPPAQPTVMKTDPPYPTSPRFSSLP